MDLEKSMITAASGMRAQSARMRLIAENIANANSTSNRPGEDPYRRKVLTFAQALDQQSSAQVVEVDKVSLDKSPFREKYDPGNPAADGRGYVKLPNVNALIEMIDMKEAQRSYEANLTSIESAKHMISRTVDLLR
ncbi:flagellar basal body rod protein FlgC [Minwuia thermotolerans]|jgi:flagellar basal-body rod protein FlgC|uniref:Flagellar basal-body rod protein FlgC n=1 Tax=Minwuia thermotolerans TaxID=2056226 RepID=A0A2M9G6Q6_9PROT|nr:flagellar basal body rod protein FlgC [Minwuia thermotolerans]ANK81047.1 MAG: flagellar basal body rod protein FlgC [Rhizobiales bacterium NRL2]PJK31409.1 flagellar basal body rod protein FlgC [Minwuia thermotolerans]